MQFPSQAARDLAARLNGVKCDQEQTRLTDEDVKNGLVVVSSASGDWTDIRGAIVGTVRYFGGGTVFLKNGKVLDESDFVCGCAWAERARKAAQNSSRSIEPLWREVDGYLWTYRTDIPHVEFDVMEDLEDGETYCRGIVFDIAALDLPVEK